MKSALPEYLKRKKTLSNDRHKSRVEMGENNDGHTNKYNQPISCNWFEIRIDEYFKILKACSEMNHKPLL